MKNWILIPHIQVQNANALSSPFTIGFPAMTAWLGAVHALQRKLNDQNIPAVFSSVGLVVHEFELQIFKGPEDYVYSIVGTGNPLVKNKKTGDFSSPPFIEEARCHLTVSLIIEFDQVEVEDEKSMLDKIHNLLIGTMKLAGGDILSCKKPEIIRDFRKAKYKLMPGYVLIERKDLMKKSMEAGLDAMDAMLDYLVVHHDCSNKLINDKEEVSWTSRKKSEGWIIPIAVGFQGISELGTALNQRDEAMPHRFAESIVTLGEFKMAYHFDSPDEFLWKYQVDLENDLYLCVQQKNEIENSDDY